MDNNAAKVSGGEPVTKNGNPSLHDGHHNI